MKRHTRQAGNSMKRMARWHLVFAAGLLLALTSTAQAYRQVLPATICQPWGGNASSVSSKISYSQFGGVLNTHTSQRLGVVCPVPRHNQSHSVNWVRVYYDDNHPVGGGTHSLSCRLWSNSAYGEQSIDSQVVGTNSAGGTYSGFWQFSSVEANNSANYPSNYTLFCLIPPMYDGNASSIGSIVVDEPN